MSGRQAMVRWLAGVAIIGAVAVPGLAEARWHRVLSIPQGTIGGSLGFRDVSCPESSWCMAVGYGSNQTYSSVWAGGFWTDGSTRPRTTPSMATSVDSGGWTTWPVAPRRIASPEGLSKRRMGAV